MVEPLNLTGSRVLVIGAGSPAGAAIAVALAEAGADVAVAAASLDGGEVMAVRRVKRQIEGLGRRSFDSAFDVTLGQNVQVSTRQVAKALGGLDVMVYAVDHVFLKPGDQITEAEWQRVITLNLSGAFFACRAALREMLPVGRGRIILAAAGPEEGGVPGAAAYAAARSGMAGLAGALAAEVEAQGVRVNAILPGWLAAPRGVRDPAGLPAATPRDIAALAVYLASDAAGGVTGRVLDAAAPGI
jgi:3-oxoacyl-[acyl-carrier protein] reductase